MIKFGIFHHWMIQIQLDFLNFYFFIFFIEETPKSNPKLQHCLFFLIWLFQTSGKSCS